MALQSKIIIILVVGLIAVGSVGTVIYRASSDRGINSVVPLSATLPEGQKVAPDSSDSSTNFQEILNSYSVCVNKKDVDCQCEYLIDYHCAQLRKNGSNPETEAGLAVAPKLLKSEGILTLGTEGNNISGLDPKIYTRVAQFFFLAESGKNSGLCFSLKFVEERGKWKVFDRDGPGPVSACI